MGQERRWAEVIETFQAKVVVDMRVAGVHTREYLNPRLPYGTLRCG